MSNEVKIIIEKLKRNLNPYINVQITETDDIGIYLIKVYKAQTTFRYNYNYDLLDNYIILKNKVLSLIIS